MNASMTNNYVSMDALKIVLKYQLYGLKDTNSAYNFFVDCMRYPAYNQAIRCEILNSSLENPWVCLQSAGPMYNYMATDKLLYHAMIIRPWTYRKNINQIVRIYRNLSLIRQKLIDSNVPDDIYRTLITMMDFDYSFDTL